VFRQNFQIALQSGGVRVEVDEHKATPEITSNLSQAKVLIVDMGEIPTAGNLPQRAVQMPGHAVEGTAQKLFATARGTRIRELHTPGGQELTKALICPVS